MKSGCGSRLDIKDLTVKRGLKTPVRDFSCSLKGGEISVLLGRNGSGKTTILQALTGFLRYSGTIEYNGEDLSMLSQQGRARIISYMPQVLPDTEMTVFELVSCGLAANFGVFYRLSAEDKRRVAETLQSTGLKGYADVPVCELSGGERQRAFFAMMKIKDAPVILLDEPTANLDSDAREMVYAFARECKAAGKVVLIVLHHKAETERIADKILEIDKKNLLV